MQIQPTEKDIQSLAIYPKLLSYPESYDMENDLISLKHWLDLTSNNFATRLKQNYPYLTRRETNLCCLLRMGYSWENISALMGVKKGSIYRLVYRLCKKIRLCRNQRQRLFGYYFRRQAGLLFPVLRRCRGGWRGVFLPFQIL